MGMLNITSTGGTFDPYIKYNAKAGRWYVKKDDKEQEIQNPVFVADFDNIKTGWILFLEGRAPSKVYDASIGNPAERPDEKHKRGFSLRMFSKAFGGVVELSSSSMHLCASIDDLYQQYDAGKASNKGMLPVVKYTGSTPMKDKMGTNYKPNFVIEKWVARPAEFETSQDNTPVEAPAPKAAATSEF